MIIKIHVESEIALFLLSIKSRELILHLQYSPNSSQHINADLKSFPEQNPFSRNFLLFACPCLCHKLFFMIALKCIWRSNWNVDKVCVAKYLSRSKGIVHSTHISSLLGQQIFSAAMQVILVDILRVYSSSFAGALVIIVALVVIALSLSSQTRNETNC